MFGGLAILLDGNMAAGVYGDDLLVRTDPGQQDALLAEPGTRPFDMTSRARIRIISMANRCPVAPMAAARSAR